MKKYFVYLLKKNLLPLACFTLFCMVMYLVPVSVESYSRWNDAETYYLSWPIPSPQLYIETISAALGILSIVIPIWLFSYKMNRRSADLCYSLPISRTKILAVNFAVGLILMYAAYSVTFFLGMITIAVKVRRLHMIYYLWIYLASIIPSFMLYSLTTFLFTRANTVIDGILTVIGVMCLLPLAAAAVDEIGREYFNRLSQNFFYIDSTYFFPFRPLSAVTDYFGAAVVSGKVSLWFNFTVSPAYAQDVTGTVCEVLGSCLWLLLAAGATVALFLTEKNCKAENCGQITESLFGYKTLLPVYTVIVTAATWAAGGDIVTFCAIAFGAAVLAVLYKRTFKVGWKFALVLVACLVGGLLLGLIPGVIYDAVFVT